MALAIPKQKEFTKESYACMYVYVCMYVHVCMYVYMYVHVCMYVYTCICILVSYSDLFIIIIRNH